MYNGQKEKYVAVVFTFGHGSGTIGINLTRFLAAFDGTAVTGDTYRVVMTRGGTIKNLSMRASTSTTLNGTGHSVEVLINGVSAPTPLIATWNAPSLYVPPTAISAPVNVGDVVSVRLKTKGTSGTLSRPTVSFDLEVDADYPSPWDYDPTSQALSYAGGDVAIGTTTSNDALTVHGMIETNGGIRFPDGSIQLEAASPATGALHSLDAADGNPVDAVFVAAGGNVAIGIDPTDRVPQQRLTLAPDSTLATEMSTPSGLTITPKAPGGLPSPDTYYFRVAASDGIGWTKASAEVAFTLTTGNNGCTINWQPVHGCRQYKIYLAMSPGGTCTSIGTGLTYYVFDNTGQFQPDTPQEVTTAFINKLSAAGDSWVLGGKLGIGTPAPSVSLHIRGDGQIYLEGAPGSGARIYYLESETTGWAQGTQNGEPTQDFNLFNYSLYQVALSVSRATNRLHARAGIDSPSFITSSSKRWKKNIQTLTGSLDTIRRLRGVAYDQQEDDRRAIGLIAEEVGAVIPEIVTYEDNGTDARGVDYSRLVAVLVEAVKEQQGQIEALQNAVGALLVEKGNAAGVA